MSLINNSYYNELCKTMSPYQAVIWIAQNTRQITNSLDNRITTAKALDFAARGELPDPKDYPDHRLDRVKNYIAYIEDEEIKQAIIASYEESLKKYRLIYVYNYIEDEPRKSRVRIIMNILWDTRPHKKS